jgi:hypothetical protein
VSAQFAEMVLKHLSRINNLDLLLQEIERWKKVFGEIFLSIEWDKTKGDVNPKTKERVGEVCYKLKEPFYIFPEPKRRWEDVSYMIEIYEVINVEEARVKYKAKDLQADKSLSVFENISDEVEKKLPDDVVIYRITHPPDEFLPEGFMCWLTKDKVLDVAKKYPYSHNSFPYERLTDTDVPGRLHGMSILEQLKPLQHNYNKLTSLATRNIYLTAHPKIFMPEGAAKIESMGNAATVVTFSGPVAPTIQTFPSNPPEVYGYRQEIKEEMQQIGGVFGVSRGEPPPGIRAGIALQFLEEQEQQRANTSIVKHNDFIVRLNKKAISVVGDYYKTESTEEGGDGRLLRILGKNKQYELETLEDVNLSRSYDIVIQNSTALAESKAGRIQQVVDLVQNIPGIFTPQQAADALDLASPDKFYDVATAALRSAEAENERMLQGREVALPTEYEQSVVHWNSHMIGIQSRSFKENVPDDFKKIVFKHIMTTEGIMFEQAMKNPELGQAVRALPGFPAFYEPDGDEKIFLETGQIPPEPVSPEEQAMAQGQGIGPGAAPPGGPPAPTGGAVPVGGAPTAAPAPPDVAPPTQPA